MKRVITTLLALTFVLLHTACKKGGNEMISTGSESGETSDKTDVSVYPDDLPDGLRFDGETVTFLYREEVADEFCADSETGDVVNDSIYRSFRSVEERLGVEIVTIKREGHLKAVRSEYTGFVKGSIMAGDNEFDWADILINSVPSLLTEKLFIDITENKYIDLDKPYYLEGLRDTLGINGKLWLLTGDASLGYLKSAFCLFFNQRLADQFKVEDLYALVDSGDWTIDKLYELTSSVSGDLNGDGKYTLDDRLGFVVHDRNHAKGFIASTGTHMFTKENGEWKFTYGSERDADVCAALYDLFFRADGSYYGDFTNGDSDPTYDLLTKKFVSGEIFMITAELDDSVSQLRDMTDDFGILPYPKYDKTQETYTSSARTTHNSFLMPVTVNNPDAAGAVMEALSSSNYLTVSPTYFETALKEKYSRDSDSARMYDIIKSGMTLDFGYAYSDILNWPDQIFQNSCKAENSFASNLAGRKDKCVAKLEEFIETIQ